MTELVRQEIAAVADTIVVKVGTRVLAREDGTLEESQVAALAEQLARLADGGRRVVLVSSGAVAAGLGRLEVDRRPTDLAELQAIAAVGQSRLIEVYNRALESHGRRAAQILLTADDLHDRTRYLNVRNTILALFRYGAIPIINENDTVRVDELQRNVGDNDRLAAMVTNLIRAPLLVLLSDVAGLYDGDPRDSKSRVIPTVTELDEATLALARPAGEDGRGKLSRGGMASKLEAARIATAAGENVVIADGRRPNVLLEILEGQEIGTLILAKGPSITSKKRWIGFVVHPRGKLVLDEGAVTAIVKNGRSLLAIGVSEVEGEFHKGDVVSLCRQDGRELARGLINYDSGEMRQIARQTTEKIIEILGHRPYAEVVHRDNLTLIG
jgi:glutamate 5-kinase